MKKSESMNSLFCMSSQSVSTETLETLSESVYAETVDRTSIENMIQSGPYIGTNDVVDIPDVTSNQLLEKQNGIYKIPPLIDKNVTQNNDSGKISKNRSSCRECPEYCRQGEQFKGKV